MATAVQHAENTTQKASKNTAIDEALATIDGLTNRKGHIPMVLPRQVPRQNPETKQFFFTGRFISIDGKYFDQAAKAHEKATGEKVNEIKVGKNTLTRDEKGHFPSARVNWFVGKENPIVADAAYKKVMGNHRMQFLMMNHDLVRNDKTGKTGLEAIDKSGFAFIEAKGLRERVNQVNARAIKDAVTQGNQIYKDKVAEMRSAKDQGQSR
ncbi:hypothetical protein [Microvirga tunisiensis]|uniref:Uncharacterized protein n=1 Tax=Microvirga tunisiensis TaxID=2108360 RepID=A0A5N7MA98_9HYPH|nr:hypothetical protein [Microvirga tunisiensis]MPR05622.1 hypothetical protein [Microvirga tunisiensis]MPR23822.1 hypothetical protein [Microvirga tunisiensis]